MMNGGGLPAVRLAHFSDVHVTAEACTWRRTDWFNKRMSAWVNLRLLGRGHRFRHSERILSTLVEDLRQRHYDRILFSGDATALGFEEEMARAASLLGVGRTDLPPGLAVPGNHDYLTRHEATSGRYEHYFAPWQQGERVDSAVYPFAQRVGPAWVIAVNSATANRLAWDASGRVGAEQLGRLERLLDRLEGGPRILVTHYPVWLADGRREKRLRALRDLDAMVDVCVRGGIGLWLHGHRHHHYHNPSVDQVPFPVICAGSVTQRGLWAYKDYSLVGQRLSVVTRVFDSDSNGFRDGAAYELKLPGASATASVQAAPSADE
jgi:3',5'-cyclic AMP phosphodiesterase CpdA